MPGGSAPRSRERGGRTQQRRCQVLRARCVPQEGLPTRKCIDLTERQGPRRGRPRGWKTRRPPGRSTVWLPSASCCPSHPLSRCASPCAIAPCRCLVPGQRRTEEPSQYERPSDWLCRAEPSDPGARRPTPLIWSSTKNSLSVQRGAVHWREFGASTPGAVKLWESPGRAGGFPLGIQFLALRQSPSRPLVLTRTPEVHDPGWELFNTVAQIVS